MSEIGLFVSSTCNFNIVVHMEAHTRATLTVLTQEQTVCAGVKVEVVCRFHGRLAYNVAARTQDTCCKTCSMAQFGTTGGLSIVPVKEFFTSQADPMDQLTGSGIMMLGSSRAL